MFEGDKYWQGIKVTEGEFFAWEPDSTYIRNPTFFEVLNILAIFVSFISSNVSLAFLHLPVTKIKEDIFFIFKS